MAWRARSNHGARGDAPLAAVGLAWWLRCMGATKRCLGNTELCLGNNAAVMLLLFLLLLFRLLLLTSEEANSASTTEAQSMVPRIAAASADADTEYRSHGAAGDARPQLWVVMFSVGIDTG